MGFYGNEFIPDDLLLDQDLTGYNEGFMGGPSRYKETY